MIRCLLIGGKVGAVMGRGYIEYLMPDSQESDEVLYSALIDLRFDEKTNRRLLPGFQRSELVLYSAYFDYRLADGTKLHVLQQPAWCRKCGRFVIAEQIPPVDKFEDEIARFRAGDPELLDMWAFMSNGIPFEERIHELIRYIGWRRERQSPPRCLDCGSADAFPIPQDGEFQHPHTGERVIVGSSGWTDAGPDIKEFSSEGIRLTP